MALEGQEFSHYRILQLVGKGGMGEVYLLEDLRVQRQVAGKFIRMEDQEAASSTLRLFWREATAIARLDHPTILPLYDHGQEVIDGTLVAYLIMPYRSEGSLVAWLRTRTRDQQTQQLTLKQITHVIQQASQSLQYAHDHQIMHLDVKPANFLIRSRHTSDDYPDLLLSDFGIARLATMTSNYSQHVSGTPTYMSPEQCNGQPGFASDQYALAIMAYELLMGSPPFQGTPMSVMFAQVHEQPPSVSARNPLLPPAVDPVLQRALAKKPEERFPSIAAFAHAFQQACQGIDETATLRVLRPSSATPTPQMSGTPTPIGDIRATLAISAEEAWNGTLRHLTLANGRVVSVQIPPDAQSDQVLILIGQGEVLVPGTPAGNLYLTLSVVKAPMQVFPTSSDMAPTARSSQAFPPAPVVAPLEEKMTPPSTLSRSVSSLYNPTILSASTSTQIALPSQDSNTFPPLSIPSKRRLSRPMGILLLVLILVLLGGASLEIYRTSINRGPGDASQQHFPLLYGITWSDSQYVTLGSAGTILTSPDGHTWTPQNTGTSQVLHSVVWSGSQFVAVGGYTILTSPDGHTWTLQQAGTSHYPTSIAWSGSQFVAVGGYTILTSPDGRAWTAQKTGASQYLYAVAWLGSQFVAVGDAGTILTSPDGRSWTAQNSGTSQYLHSVTWSGSQYVAVGGTSTILTSPDGRSWTLQQASVYQYLYAVAWLDSQFVAVGGSGTILTSPDGRAWTAQHSGTSQDLRSVVWSGSQFMAVGASIILTSPNGRSWSTV